MNTENQHIEWKESWRDEYLKWIAGFANANGGKLIIGKNDKGDVVGVANATKLLEDIPNKVRDILGIIVEVNLFEINGLSIIEIDVEAYPYPINYKGEYHFRTGSTKQELKGTALNKFILEKSGKHWDSIPLPQLKIEDLDANAFNNFQRKAKRSNRIDESYFDSGTELLLNNLHLIDNKQLKRACALLFYQNPEKYITGSYIKIGFFQTDADLVFQDEIHGNLFEQVDKTMDMLFTKYMYASISYEGVSRIEKFPFPEPAIREALLNAVAHKDYSSGIPIQISVYKDKLIIWNEGHLPPNWTVETILGKHPSKPANPDIAHTLFRAGMIESWGRGITKIVNECLAHNIIPPQINTDFGGLMITFFATEDEKSTGKITGKSSGKSSGKNSGKSSEKIFNLISKYREITIQELADNLNLSVRTVNNQILKLKNNEQLERIGGDKGGYWKVSIIENVDEESAQKSAQKNAQKSTEKTLILIEANSEITIPELASLLKVSTRTIEKNIAKLKSNNKLERVGSDKGGYWKVIKSEVS